jgi:hypothetical protein
VSAALRTAVSNCQSFSVFLDGTRLQMRWDSFADGFLLAMVDPPVAMLWPLMADAATSQCSRSGPPEPTAVRGILHHNVADALGGTGSLSATVLAHAVTNALVCML